MNAGGAAGPGSRSAKSGDPGFGTEREHLESERDFLLASLADLDREHEAGDLDDGDYERLRDDYTARAADVLRSLDALDASAGRSPRGSRRDAPVDGGSRRRAAGAGSRTEAGDLDQVAPSAADDKRSMWRWAAVVTVIAALTGVLVVQAAGDRGSGGISGDIRQSSTGLLADARDAFAEGDAERALRLYDEVLEQAPTNIEALTYKAWVGRNSGALTEQEALDLLDRALEVNPRHPDAMVFRSIVLDRLGRPGEAADQLIAVGVDLVPTYMVQMVTGFGITLAGTLASGGDPAKANETLDHVLELDPGNVTALATKGSLLAAVAEVAEGEDRTQIAASASATMDRAVEAAEDDPNELPAALLARAEVRARLGDTAGALQDLDRLDEMGVPEELARRAAAVRGSLPGGGPTGSS